MALQTSFSKTSSSRLPYVAGSFPAQFCFVLSSALSLERCCYYAFKLLYVFGLERAYQQCLAVSKLIAFAFVVCRIVRYTYIQTQTHEFLHMYVVRTIAAITYPSSSPPSGHIITATLNTFRQFNQKQIRVEQQIKADWKRRGGAALRSSRLNMKRCIRAEFECHCRDNLKYFKGCCFQTCGFQEETQRIKLDIKAKNLHVL